MFALPHIKRDGISLQKILRMNDDPNRNPNAAPAGEMPPSPKPPMISERSAVIGGAALLGTAGAAGSQVFLPKPLTMKAYKNEFKRLGYDPVKDKAIFESWRTAKPTETIIPGDAATGKAALMGGKGTWSNTGKGKLLVYGDRAWRGAASTGIGIPLAAAGGYGADLLWNALNPHAQEGSINSR
jgi:hypothetical protein